MSDRIASNRDTACDALSHAGLILRSSFCHLICVVMVSATAAQLNTPEFTAASNACCCTAYRALSSSMSRHGANILSILRSNRRCSFRRWLAFLPSRFSFRFITYPQAPEPRSAFTFRTCNRHARRCSPCKNPPATIRIRCPLPQPTQSWPDNSTNAG